MRRWVLDLVISVRRTSLRLPNSQTGRILESNSVLSILLPLIRITWNFSYVKSLQFPPFNWEHESIRALTLHIYIEILDSLKKNVNFISCQREFTTEWWQREKIKSIPAKPKLAPIWLNVKLKINAISFFLPHPTRHGRYSCRGWEDSSRGRCKQGNWNSVAPHPLSILPGHLLMVAACAVEVISPADSRKPSCAAGVW